MKIVVAIKQVPNTNNVKLNAKGTLEREGIDSIINPDDKHAIQAACELKAEYGGKITVISMGPPQAELALREALAMGCDNAVLLSDRAFAGADTWATSYTISQGIKKIGDFDLIICGKQAIDGDTAQVGPQIAGNLDIPQITYSRKIEFKNDVLTVERELDDGYEILETKLPCLLTVVKELNTPDYPSIRGVYDAYAKDIEILDATKIGANPERIGLEGSPTKVRRSFTPKPKGKGIVISGSNREIAEQLVSHLSDKNIISRL